jgi:ribose transport system substrate-binding protein
MQRFLIRVLGLPLVFLFLFACNGKDDSPVAGPNGKTQKEWVIAFSQCTVNEPWRQEMNNRMIETAKKHPEITLAVSVGQDDTQQQVADVESFLSQGIDLLIISPKEAAPLTDIVKKVYQSGIPVIVLDRKILGDTFTCFIGADNFLIGKEAGKCIVDLLGGKGNIVELKGNMSSTPGQDRHKGFREAIKAHLESGDLAVVHEADCDWKEDKARVEMEAALSANPEIDLVYGHNDPMAHGAYQAARQAGREKEIRFIGIDSLPHEGVAYVKEGILSATIEYPTGAEKAIEVAMKLLQGQKVPKNITLGTRIHTREGVREIN